MPFGSVLGNRARLAGLNLIGLKRRGYDRAQCTGCALRVPPAVSGSGALGARRVFAARLARGARRSMRARDPNWWRS